MKRAWRAAGKVERRHPDLKIRLYFDEDCPVLGEVDLLGEPYALAFVETCEPIEYLEDGAVVHESMLKGHLLSLGATQEAMEQRLEEIVKIPRVKVETTTLLS
jgi:hypothetical protein